MATQKEINSHLAQALEEIGTIKPWFSKEYDAWIFSHPLYPVEYAGETKEDVIKNFPLYMREFIKYRLKDKLDPLMESKTKGHGGKRVGAGRPKGTNEEKERIYVPKDIARFLKEPGAFVYLRGIINCCNHARL